MSVNIKDLRSKLNKYRTNTELPTSNILDIKTKVIGESIDTSSALNISSTLDTSNINDINDINKKPTIKSSKIKIKKLINSDDKNTEIVEINKHNKLGLDVVLMQKRLQKYTDSKNYRNKMQQDKLKVVEEKESIDILRSDNIFNIVNDSNLYLTWRKIEKDNQKEILMTFFKKLDPPVDQEAIDKIFALIDIKKLYIKREIEYDKINVQILSLPIMQYDDISKKYLVVKTIIKKKYNAKKSARQFLKQ